MMKGHWKPRLLSAVIALVLSAWAGVASADVVTAWNDHLLAVTTAASVNRPNAEIGAASAYMHIAMYDAISSIDGNYIPFATHVTNAPAGASREAAAIEAAYRIVAYLYPAATFPGPAMQFANFYALDMGTISNGLAKTDGMAVGLAAAGGLIALRQNDGFRAIVPYTFLPLGPGVYQKTPGPDGTIGTYIGPATPWMKQFRPFAMLAPDQFRADPPPALDSAQWAEDFNEVKAFGAASNLPNSRSAEQEEIGLFYGLINAQVQVNRNLRKLAADQGLSVVAAA